MAAAPPGRPGHQCPGASGKALMMCDIYGHGGGGAIVLRVECVLLLSCSRSLSHPPYTTGAGQLADLQLASAPPTWPTSTTARGSHACEPQFSRLKGRIRKRPEPNRPTVSLPAAPIEENSRWCSSLRAGKACTLAPPLSPICPPRSPPKGLRWSRSRKKVGPGCVAPIPRTHGARGGRPRPCHLQTRDYLAAAVVCVES